MYKFRFIYILAFIALAMSSCRKDFNDFITDPKSQEYSGSILGYVIDESGLPVKDARVTFDNKIKTTDENGVYQFKNVQINSRHNIINIKKEGYFEGSRVFTTDRATTISVRNILLAKNFDQSFESSVSGKVNKGSITLDFPSDAIVMASSGSTYNGTVKIAMKYLDPSKREIYDQMPGDLVGVNADEQIAVMFSFGMVAVELQSPSGQLLQIAPGKKVKMSNKLTSAQASRAPSTIPLWYYDENLGYWKEEGEAQLINDTYTGEVGHFTYWNYDAQAPSIILSGRVVDNLGNPIPNAHVWVQGAGQAGSGHGLTNPDGTFSGMVAKDVLLDITVTIYVEGCNYTEVYSGQAGPFSTDASLPDLVANTATLNTLTVTANVVDCASLPVQNGYVKATSGNTILAYLEINNGLVSSNIVTCTALNNVTFVAVDIITLEQSDAITVPVGSNIDLGIVNACGNQVDFIKVQIPGLSIDTTLLQNLSISNNFFKEVHSGNNIDSATNVMLNLYWNEADNNVITPGTYPIFPNETNVVLFGNPANQGYLSGISGNVIVTQGGSQSGDVITGTYDFLGQILGTIITHQVTGSFRITLP